MKTKRSTHSRSTVGIEICRSHLHLARLIAGQPTLVRTRSVRWRHDAASMLSDQGERELRAGMKAIVSQEKLHGQRVSLAFNGDFCVTRVLTGSADEVRRELAQLEERSSLYLSLGTGPKALAASVRQIDVRHQHALLTVANKKTLETIVSAVNQLGIEIDTIEPSLVALSRCVGRIGRDASRPVLIVMLNESGVELGITYQGQLILDYRPGGRSAKEGVAMIVTNHLARLQRYCQRHYGYTEGQLDHVILCGTDDAIAPVRMDLEREEHITVEVLDLADVDADWEFAEETIGSEVSAALGVCLFAGDASTPRDAPNLMEQLRAEKKTRLLPALAKTAWPVAASIAVALGLFMLTVHEGHRNTMIANRLSEYETSKLRAGRLKSEMMHADQKAAQFSALENELSNPAWSEALSHVGHCMPNDVWLERFDAAGDGTVTMSGSGYTDDAVYELVRWLQQAPGISGVSLEGTRTGSGRTGRVIKFDVHCKFTDQAAASGQGDTDG
ncbi:MAG: PilN domain-containing protein [Planctomycetes bacterium]|nr:PilN domain-containing protein [Planctomycetota bacterium]